MTQRDADPALLQALWALDVVGRKSQDFRAPHDMHDRVHAVYQLPPMPEMARRILALRDDPHADARKLARIVEMDPHLAGQLIRWSNSAFYGFRSRIISVRDAITLVLGYEQVLNLTLALCAIRPFDAPREGPLGRRFFWRQTLAGSAVMQKLLPRAKTELHQDGAAIHLLYLLHNVGHLLLAHLFKPEFDYLRCAVNANPGIRLVSLERFLLNVDHAQLGAWLMESWELPEVLRTVTLHHHNPYYRGAHEELVWLTCLTDRLLGELGIGDACHCPATNSHLLQQLRLEPDDAERCLREMEDSLRELEQAVDSLC